MAIGIVSVALLAVVGLLPVGLQSVRNANELAGASLVMNRLADAVGNVGSKNGICKNHPVRRTGLPHRVGQPVHHQ